MELSVESSCLHVTWKVRDFLDLPWEIGYYLDSPEFLFAGDSYFLRLYPNGSRKYAKEACCEIVLVRLTSTFPERSVSCTFGQRLRDKGGEFDTYFMLSALNKLFLKRFDLDIYSDTKVPDGTLTYLCLMRLKEQSSALSQQSKEVKISNAKEEQKGLPGQSVFFSSRLRSFKMELSTESPYQHVTWKIPDFFQLLSKIGYFLNSPEFRFAGERYCLRFYPKGNKNGDTVDTDLHLVKLTSTFPEMTVLYKVGYRGRDSGGRQCDIYTYSGTSTEEFGFWHSRSQLEENENMFVPDGTLTVLCSLHLKEQSSAGSPQSKEAGNAHVEQKLEGLPDVTLLSERMKDLLNRGSDYDLTICVQNKEFPAHRNILSANSPVFAVMLAHGTKEYNTGTISIEDCDPDSFDEFLLYVYSKKIENLTPSNAFHIYYIADKYDFPALKEWCVRILKTSLSITSICDTVRLAAKHREMELLEMASEFFARNIDEILITVGWQRFLSQNPVEANELYIKSIKFWRPKK